MLDLELGKPLAGPATKVWYRFGETGLNTGETPMPREDCIHRRSCRLSTWLGCR